jgi:hypothetical protein
VSDVMLTTVDNPYDPFDSFDDWYAWDERSGYCTSSMLGRIAMVSDELSEADLSLAIEQAIDEIVSENVSGMWRKVTRENSKSFLKQQSASQI